MILAVSALLFFSCSRTFQTPTETTGFEEPANYEQIRHFCEEVARENKQLELDVFGQSVEGRDLLVLKASYQGNQYEEPLRVLLFAQQHGNEQASKEGALLLIRDLANGEYDHWLQRIELWIVPQLNPDGGELNRRANAGNFDLNRDHVVKQAPETRAIHALFRDFMPHVTIDVHEYQPYRQAWADFGGYKQFDVQVGVTTNINIDQTVQQYSLTKALDHIESHLTEKGYSFHNYLVGPPPSEGITRHSTVDINDGRQSFGILQTMAFIHEGINGRDGFAENLSHRSHGQLEAKKALMDFLYENNQEVVNMVNHARQMMIDGTAPEKVAIRTGYFQRGAPLELPLKSSTTGRDTVVIVDSYHPLVKPLLEVRRPAGYLIPAHDDQLMSWIRLHHIQFDSRMPVGMKAYACELETNQGAPYTNPVPVTVDQEDYVFVPMNQLHGNFLVLTLEPMSELNIGRHQLFSYLMDDTDSYPVLRVE